MLRNTSDTVEWNSPERAENYVECFGSADVTALVDPQILTKFSEKGVRPIEEIEVGEKDICWFCVQDVTPKKTKNGKSYLLVSAVGLSGKAQRLNVWGWDNVRTFNAYTLCLAEVERNDFGHSTTMWKLKELNTEN